MATPSAIRSHALFRFTLCFLMGLVVTECSADEAIEFNRDIRPLLSENCFHCHGPDESNRAADLRLDTDEGAKEWAIVAGDAGASEVVTRVFSDDADIVMPPPDSGRSLTNAQKQLISKWIQQGAAYQKHWSFEPVVSTRPPSVDAEWANHPIDRFIARRLREHSLVPSKIADRETLIRRVTFDLVGVPPTLDEIDRFIADTSSNAWEKVIDRLLADPRFGERMAADWLDVARYSDTYGYQVDRDRFVWPWRDWVTRAFNQNLSYDQFVTQQIAGDLVPNADRNTILATTFNRLHPQKVEGGSVPEEFRIEYVADRTQTVGTAFLGLTMECCRCHTHKYDPITQSEYYELSAFFDNIDEAGLYSYFTSSIPTPTLPLPSSQQQHRLETLLRETAELEAQIRQRESERRVPSGLADLFGDTADACFAQPIESLELEDSSNNVSPKRSIDGNYRRGGLVSGDDA
ncbi:MAG: DUF1549 domain-containing protein, partial [Planctomycetota bacterium]